MMMKQKGKDQVRGVITTIILCFADGKVVYRGYKVNFSRISDFTWSLSDCEELVGVISGDNVVDFGGVISVLLLSHISICSFRLCYMW